MKSLKDSLNRCLEMNFDDLVVECRRSTNHFISYYSGFMGCERNDATKFFFKIISSIVYINNISNEEYNLFVTLFKTTISYDDFAKLIKWHVGGEGQLKQVQNEIHELIDYVGNHFNNTQIKSDIIFSIMCFAAVDKNVSQGEFDYIMDLFI